ncbi:apoptosis-enhancing nuclease [Gracilinanus agilis]|uniref:apoptosis-enhancing nuclease n=1 Tax=Gracilinanus agilis TaxID=191870 RepID=UPI001CFCE642|nr:apoptosis-enhancing nuclease [Gracilinanus agilis]
MGSWNQRIRFSNATPAACYLCDLSQVSSWRLSLHFPSYFSVLSRCGSQPGREMATHGPLAELAAMTSKESSKSFQGSSAPLTNSTGKDTPRWWYKRRSRRHQRFMVHKALLEKRGVLSVPPESESPLQVTRPEVLEDTEASKYGVQQDALGSPGPQPRRKQLQKMEPNKGTASGHALPNKCVAIDCEMVGTGPGGRVSELARCSVVSYHGDVLYDKYIRPETPIVDYRTRWSGITRQHMQNAIPFRVAQKEILKLLKGKLVVGHALHNDFRALKYFHPRRQTRDTLSVPSLINQTGFPVRAQSSSLKNLALQLLNKRIQVGQHGHSSVEDATTAMELYRLVEAQWEQKEASSHPSSLEDSLQDSGTDTEHYMEDQYWLEDQTEGCK